VIEVIARCQKPVVDVVHGYRIGGGAELVAAVDTRARRAGQGFDDPQLPGPSHCAAAFT
jgi:enoyl-CoA hydratase/carnithine racemase